MKDQLLRALVIASFATVACNAGAQNATSPMGAQNGTPAQTPPAGSYSSDAPASATGNSQTTRARMTSEQIREYTDARNACNSQTGPQMASCNNDVNKKFSSVDAKCQKVSGQALADCLRGADHAN